MTTIDTVQEALLKLHADLEAKGYDKTRVRIIIKPQMEYGPFNLDIWAESRDYGSDTSKFIYEDSWEEALTKAQEFVGQLPSIEDAQKNNFYKKLAETIEFGREIGIETAYLNPLEQIMNELSENIIEHKPEEEIPF